MIERNSMLMKKETCIVLLLSWVLFCSIHHQRTKRTYRGTVSTFSTLLLTCTAVSPQTHNTAPPPMYREQRKPMRIKHLGKCFQFKRLKALSIRFRSRQDYCGEYEKPWRSPLSDLFIFCRRRWIR
jgi:hypothetical protein